MQWRERGTALNFGCYVGHTAVRLYVMGEDAYERPATDEEISLMQAVVADAMAGGAAGFASSASPTHNGDHGRPVPSRVADLAELRALLEPVKQCGHWRSDQSVEVGLNLFGDCIIGDRRSQ